MAIRCLVKIFIGFFIVLGNLSTPTWAADIMDIRVDHPSNYGSTLVGSAKVYLDSVQWLGSQQAGGMRIYAGGVFGFTGQANYTIEGIADNTWSWEEYTIVTGRNMQVGGRAPSMGHFFAPDTAREFGLTGRYEAFVGPDIIVRNAPLKGVGVADNEVAPALLLDVEVTGGHREGGNISTGRQETVIFKVTPRVDFSRLSDTVAPVEYVMVQIGVREDGTPCNGSAASFQIRNATDNSFIPDDYYQYLYAGERFGVPVSCSYSVRSLVGIDQNTGIGKTFQFTATDQRDTGSGYVNLIFSILGHYQTLNETRWPGSHATYRLRRDNDREIEADTGMIPVASFSVTPESGTAPLDVELDASASSDSDGTVIRYAWAVRKDGQVISITQANPTRPQASMKLDSPGEYMVSLIVTDNNGNISTTAVKTILVEDAGLQPVFTVAPNPAYAFEPIRLQVAEPRQDWSYQWISAGQNIPRGTEAQLIYNSPGTRDITLQAYDALGKRITAAPVTLPLEVNYRFMPSFTLSDTDGKVHVGANVMAKGTFDESSLDDSEYFIMEYGWIINGQMLWAQDLVDGTHATSDYAIEFLHQGQSARLHLRQAGTYDIAQVFRDNFSHPIRSELQTLEVIEQTAPLAEFDIEPVSDASRPFTVRLNALASYDPDNRADPGGGSAFNRGITRYQWGIVPANPINGWWNSPDEEEPLFAPQTLGNDSQPVVTFYRAGPYQITLTVTDDEQQASSASHATVLWNTATGADSTPYELGEGINFNSSIMRLTQNTGSLFLGGIQSLDDGVFILPTRQDDEQLIRLTPESKVNIVMGIEIFEGHRAQPINIIVLMVHTAMDGSVTFAKKSAAFAEQGYWQPDSILKPGVWPPFFSSTADSEVSLGSWLDVPVYRGGLEDWEPGRYEIHTGYILFPPDGWVMFFNGTPLIFEIR